MMTMKSALITGAASGIGKACAERMAQEGYGVVVADVNLPAAEELAAKLAAEGRSAIAVHMDVADEQEVEAGFDKMMETYGSCDLVMSNAGVQIVHPFEEYPFADWRKMMAIHADGAFLVSRAAYRRMKASGKGGRIVFTGSVIPVPVAFSLLCMVSGAMTGEATPYPCFAVTVWSGAAASCRTRAAS